MIFALLQNGDALDKYADGGLLEAVLSDLVAATGGEALFGSLIAGTLVLTLWIAGKRDLATPSAVLILIGGVAFTMLPGNYVGIARTIIILGGVAGVMAVARRYVLSPGAR